MGMNHALHATILVTLGLPLATQAEDAADAPEESPPVVSVGPAGFSARSADGENLLRLRGTLHLDGHYTEGEDPGSAEDGWQATRVQPLIEGTFARYYDFRFKPEFGQGRSEILDAYVTARFAPAFHLTLGKFKSPVGLERLQSSNDIRQIQRGFPTSLVPNRDVGLRVGGDLAGGRLSYALAMMNGANDGGSSSSFSDSDVNSDQEYVLRFFAHPFAASGHSALRGLGVGIAGTYTEQAGDEAATLLPAFRSPGQATFFRYRAADPTGAATIADGERQRIAPQLYWYAGALGLMGEYTEVSQDVSRAVAAGLRTGTVDTSAWQLTASWFVTGEEAAYKGFKPRKTFSLEDGTWGAFEVTARVQSLSIDGEAFAGGGDSFADPLASARRADSWTLGLNWHLNENVKWLLNYDRTTFEDGTATGDREDEDALQLRLAVGF